MRIVAGEGGYVGGEAVGGRGVVLGDENAKGGVGHGEAPKRGANTRVRRRSWSARPPSRSLRTLNRSLPSRNESVRTGHIELAVAECNAEDFECSLVFAGGNVEDAVLELEDREGKVEEKVIDVEFPEGDLVLDRPRACIRAKKAPVPSPRARIRAPRAP